MREEISVLLSEEEINRRLDEMAQQINEEYKGRPIHVIGILKGCVFFVCELTKRLTMPVTVDFMIVSSYKGTETTGQINIKKDADYPIGGQDVIVMEDIIDSGITMSSLIPMLKTRNPKSIKLAAMLSKPSRREVDVDIDYLGYEIEDKFVVGFGLDYDEKYRNLPYIGAVEFVND